MNKPKLVLDFTQRTKRFQKDAQARLDTPEKFQTPAPVFAVEAELDLIYEGCPQIPRFTAVREPSTGRDVAKRFMKHVDCDFEDKTK